jgi:hypothetical protein
MAITRSHNLGARLGNWNDRVIGRRADCRANRPLVWFLLDAVSAYLCRTEAPVPSGTRRPVKPR